MEIYCVFFYLRIIYIFLFILFVFSIVVLWVFFEVYFGFKCLDKVKWRMVRYFSYRNIIEDEM